MTSDPLHYDRQSNCKKTANILFKIIYNNSKLFVRNDEYDKFLK